MRWCLYPYVVVCLAVALHGHAFAAKISSKSKSNTKEITAFNVTTSVAKKNKTLASKKTLIDITGSEFPTINYQQPEFFFDTAHDFGKYDKDEIKVNSQISVEKEADTTRGAEERSKMFDNSKGNNALMTTTGPDESFDNDTVEASVNERTMDKLGGVQSDSYQYDDNDAQYFVNQRPDNTGAGLIMLPGQEDIAKRGWKVIAMRSSMTATSSWTVKLKGKWDWRVHISGFKYESVEFGSVGVLVDGTISKHQWIVKEMVYNMLMMFRKGSMISVASFASSLSIASEFQSFSAASQIKTICGKIQFSEGRKVGEALEAYYKNFVGVKAKKPDYKMSMFLVIKGATIGSVELIKKYGAMFKTLGVRIYVLALGSSFNVAQLQMITEMSLIYEISSYEAIMTGKGLKVGGAAASQSMFLMLQANLGSYFGARAGLAAGGGEGGGEGGAAGAGGAGAGAGAGGAAVAGQSGSGGAEGGWWTASWQWTGHIAGMQYGSVKKANVAFVIDGSDSNMITFLQRFAYNLIMMFQRQGTFVTILVYGRDQYRLSNWQEFSSAEQVQKACTNIPYVETSIRNIAKALGEIKIMFETQKKANAENGNVLFFFMAGSATDKAQLSAAGAALKALGVKCFGIGIGAQAASLKAELGMVATSAKYIRAGKLSSIVKAGSFNGLVSALSADIGQAGAVSAASGSSAMLSIQKSWKWSAKYQQLRYGYLARANVGILVEAISLENFGYIRHLIYNIIRMFALSGSYFSIVSYGTGQYRVSNFAQFTTEASIKSMAGKIPKGTSGQALTGKALSYMIGAFKESPPGNPEILFVLTQSRSSDDVTSFAAQLRKDGIKTIAFGIGTNVDSKQMMLMSYSSATMFMAEANGLVATLTSCQSAVAKSTVSGDVSTSAGASATSGAAGGGSGAAAGGGGAAAGGGAASSAGAVGTGGIKEGLLTASHADIVKNWSWRTQGIAFAYGACKKSTIGFLVDSSNQHHFDVMQKFVYNIYSLFEIGTSVSIITYGGETDKSLQKFRKYQDSTVFQLSCQAISYKGAKGRKTGAALTELAGVFGSASGAEGKQLVFLLTTGKSDDDVVGPAKSLVQKGMSIFAIGIGSSVDTNELKMISRYYLTAKWRALVTSLVKVQNSAMKVAGKSAAADSETGVQQDVSAGSVGRESVLPPASYGYLACSASQPMGSLQTKWDWSAMITSMKSGALKAANIIMAIDISQKASFEIQLRFCYNTLRLFQLSGSTVTIITYGSSASLVAKAKTVGAEAELKSLLTGISAKAEETVNCGKALKLVTSSVYSQLNKKLKTVMFVVARSRSEDDVYKAVEQLKGAQINMCGVGLGETFSQEEISVLSSTGQLSFSGSFSQAAALVVRIQAMLSMVTNGVPESDTMTRDALKEAAGADAYGSMVNTVQTGSTASEEAGKPGCPDTGYSLAGAGGGAAGGTGAGAEGGGGAGSAGAGAGAGGAGAGSAGGSAGGAGAGDAAGGAGGSAGGAAGGAGGVGGSAGGGGGSAGSAGGSAGGAGGGGGSAGGAGGSAGGAAGSAGGSAGSAGGSAGGSGGSAGSAGGSAGGAGGGGGSAGGAGGSAGGAAGSAGGSAGSAGGSGGSAGGGGGVGGSAGGAGGGSAGGASGSVGGAGGSAGGAGGGSASAGGAGGVGAAGASASAGASAAAGAGGSDLASAAASAAALANGLANLAKTNGGCPAGCKPCQQCLGKRSQIGDKACPANCEACEGASCTITTTDLQGFNRAKMDSDPASPVQPNKLSMDQMMYKLDSDKGDAESNDIDLNAIQTLLEDFYGDAANKRSKAPPHK
eukprot:gene16668-18360_t